MEENKKLYNERNNEIENKSKVIYKYIGNPPLKYFKAIIKMNAITNCPVTINEIKLTDQVFGLETKTLKENYIMKKSSPVVKEYI